MKPQVRYGLLFGAIAGVTTLVLNLANGALMTGDVCHRQGTPLPVLGFILFALLAGAAGRQASLESGPPAIAGLIVGAVSGIALLLLVAFSLGTASQAAAQCLQGAGTQGVNVAAVASGASVVLGIVIYLIGVGVGAGAGALGGAIGATRKASV